MYEMDVDCVIKNTFIPQFFSFANEQVFGNVENNSKVFSLRLDTTRVVYNQGSSGETLAVINEHDYPILVQAEVLLEDQRTPAPL